MNFHKMHVEAEYFHMLSIGTKRAEFRLLDEKRQEIQVGDFIDFFCQDDPVKRLRLKVAQIICAPTFKVLFDMLPAPTFGNISKQKQILELEKLYQHKIKNYQVIALLLEDHDP